MAAYIIADVEISDPEGYAGYTSQVPGTLAPFGGEFVVRGGHADVLEGGWRPKRLVVIRFPDRQHAEGWYQSAAYQAILPIRHQHSQGSVLCVDGV
ncbi:MAG: DUF1330 domain-containing protein [Chloroflexi bacterium]|nr:DUF1330 domain-containing protein [Chloroflexota bacterium]